MLQKKIGLIAPDFPPSLGGVQEYSYNFSKELIKQGYEIVLLVPKSNVEADFSADQIFPHRVLVFDKKQDLETIKTFDINIWHCLDASYAWLVQYFPNVYFSIHGNDFLNPYHLTEEISIKGIRIPLFSSRLKLYARRYLTKKKILSSLPMAKQVFTNSAYTRQRLINLNRKVVDNSCSIGVGVSEFFFEGDLIVRRKTKRLRLTTVSRLSETRKNIDLVLRALAKLKETNVDFSYTIIGDGSMRKQLEVLTHNLGLSRHVEFMGRVSKATIRQTLSESDLFILVSSSSKYTVEGFGIVYLEANACGTPVMAGNEGGAAEAVVIGENGFVVNEINVDGIFSGLMQFMNNKYDFNPEHCRNFASQYSWKNIVQKIISYYD
ncbi:MAG: glycosyltransferase family 4 protein [Limnothrix sp. RL_2_0]|nr:glycosyltransferase family 4 protein [Limnothrix sp. RL_2_0]